MSSTLKLENCKEERECSVDASVCVGTRSVYGEVAIYACRERQGQNCVSHERRYTL